MKLRHQDIVFSVEYQKGQINPTDCLSRRGKPLAEIPIEQQKEVDDIKNILYMLHTTPIIDNLGLTRIARETNKVEILKQLREIIERGPRWIPNTSDACLKKFEQVIPEITLTSNGILLKSERKRKYAKESINIYAKESVNNCLNCATFINKKTTEPLLSHKLPNKNWKTVAVDLFGPMPRSNHVIVVQDLSSRYRSANLVKSTSADKVIPALAEIYNDYANPENQLSDNGPPFKSKNGSILPKTQYQHAENSTIRPIIKRGRDVYETTG